MSLAPADRLHADLLDLARRLAVEAGSIQRERYETGLTIDTKSAAIDLVTEVDRACEAHIVEGIRAARSDDAILAEEGAGGDREDAAVRWIIDPLDGTTNFAHGFPRFCVSIGIECAGRRSVGVVYDPLLDERFEASLGEGAWLGERRLAVSSETELGRALVATDLNSVERCRLSPRPSRPRFARTVPAPGPRARASPRGADLPW